MKYTIVAIMLIIVIMQVGCISATSTTATEGELKAKMSQTASQSAGQESSNTNQSESSIKIDEYLDGEGKVISRTTTTLAKTGSETNQQTDMLSQIKQKIDMQEKVRAESEAKASINFTYIIVGIIALICLYITISGGSRLLAVYKKIRPI